MKSNQDQLLRKKNIPVAIIADEFTYQSFKYEFDLIPISPTNWKATFEAKQPKLFFCESAWKGFNLKAGSWQGKIYKSSKWRNENRTILLNILNYCRQHHIPTIFWNKEDPTHFNDKIHNFVDTACRFDYIFTTSIECVEGYKTLTKKDNVFVLPFATQPRLFNPIETTHRTNEVVFLGSWYEEFTERSNSMREFFDQCIATKTPLVIYDRYYKTTDKNHIYPKKYQPYLRPNIEFTQLANTYKRSHYSLNINTVTDSQTMFARRVFELISCNTFVLSSESVGVKAFFGEDVFFTSDGIDKFLQLTNQPSLIEEKKYRILRQVLDEHTYEKRASYILDQIHYPYLKEDKSCQVVFLLEQLSDFLPLLEWFRQQKGVNKTLSIVYPQNLQSSIQTLMTLYPEATYIPLQELLSEAPLLTGDYIYYLNDIPKQTGIYELKDFLLSYTYIDDKVIVSKSHHQANDYRFGETMSLHECMIPRHSIHLLKAYLNLESQHFSCFYLKLMTLENEDIQFSMNLGHDYV